MITEIYDINGTPHKVQGAGTEYNEELNSIALGTDTSATGQDQFVFGRKNVADASMVEVVGGGVKVVIEGKVHISDYGDDKQRNARVVFNIPVNRDLYNFDADTEVPAGTKNFAKYDSKMARIAKIESVMIEDGLEEVYNFFYIGGPNPYISGEQNYGDFWYFLYSPKETPTQTHLGDQFDPVRGYTLSYTSASMSKNIRTLDWNGNEHLDGSLAIGEDSVASAKGQLIYGRKNVANASLVEIVGGGTTLKIGDVVAEHFANNTLSKSIYLGKSIANVQSTIKSLALIGDTDDFVFGIGGDGELTPAQLEEYINSINGYVLCVYAKYNTTTISVYAKIEAIVANSGTKVYPRLEAENPIITYSSVQIPSTGESIREKLEYVLSQSYDMNYGLDLYVLGTSYKDIQNISSLIEYVFVASWKLIVNDWHKNIRTLDWEGNQWNAGDITCDDGNGNIISLRALAQAIAELRNL